MSNNRTALARTYRPRRFSEIATQEHVSETLRSAVARGRTAHAYLFSGPRGVGKTTAARVLAMALNCENRAEDGEPCGQCVSCDRIWSGRTSLDVVEIDAASNRGVDDARELRERAMYAPTDEHRFKVYIIDEAHMLTREAWNALLKILEEPPPRVIFILATTEPQKILQAAPPILSRCQRFDFRRIPVPQIVERLSNVLAAEGLAAEEGALVPIARRADGGMRDALSLLDQVLSFAGRKVTAEDVRRVLGWIDEEVYLDLIGIIASRRHAEVFRFVQRLGDEGYDLNEFQKGLADFLRLLLLVKLEGEVPAETREDLRPAISAAAEPFEAGDLLRMLALASELDVEGRFRKSAAPRTVLEVLLLRFSYLERTVSIEALLGSLGAVGAAAADDVPWYEAGSAAGSAATAGAAARAEPGDARRPAARKRPREASDDSAPAAPPTGDAVPLKQVLESALERKIVPSGLGIFLRLARIDLDASGNVQLTVPPGPALEAFESQPKVRAALLAEFRRELGRDVGLVVSVAGGVPDAGDAPPAPAAERLTPERLKQDRLEKLGKEKPALGRAAAAWDLELLD